LKDSSLRIKFNLKKRRKKINFLFD